MVKGVRTRRAVIRSSSAQAVPDWLRPPEGAGDELDDVVSQVLLAHSSFENPMSAAEVCLGMCLGTCQGICIHRHERRCGVSRLAYRDQRCRGVFLCVYRQVCRHAFTLGPTRLFLADHNYIGHDYICHDYTGHDSLGRSYIVLI